MVAQKLDTMDLQQLDFISDLPLNWSTAQAFRQGRHQSCLIESNCQKNEIFTNPSTKPALPPTIPPPTTTTIATSLVNPPLGLSIANDGYLITIDIGQSFMENDVELERIEQTHSIEIIVKKLKINRKFKLPSSADIMNVKIMKHSKQPTFLILQIPRYAQPQIRLREKSTLNGNNFTNRPCSRTSIYVEKAEKMLMDLENLSQNLDALKKNHPDRRLSIANLSITESK
ncbi:hypothetical protein SNEBB_004305 [Seison nebaliae]|nr:hypothetical protein SNEBB_004305 [Seison nebaliae]